MSEIQNALQECDSQKHKFAKSLEFKNSEVAAEVTFRK